MKSALPSRRFREARLLIGTTLVVLVGMVVAELAGIHSLSQSAEDAARRNAAETAKFLALVAARADLSQVPSPHGGDVGVAIVVDDDVVRRIGDAGPPRPSWWPWSSREGWENAGRPVAGPLRYLGGDVMVAYEQFGERRALRVTVPVPLASVALRWRWWGSILALVVAGGGAILAWTLIARALAPYRELLAEAVRFTGGPAGEAEDRFLVDTFRDAISRLEASEAALRQRVDELGVLAGVLTRESAAGVVITGADRTVRAANPVSHAILGEDLALGRELPSVVTDGDGTMRSGDRSFEVRRFPLLSERGVMEGEVHFLSDRTQLESLERGLREREQMASLGELAAGMAHELRNALATLRGYLRLLPEADDAQRARYLAAMESEAVNLARILDRFLTFSQPRELRREVLDARDLASQLVTRVRTAFPNVEFVTGPASATINADPLALGVALENLLRNAAEALGGSPGIVTIAVEPGPEFVRIVVSDTGPGVSREVRDRLFQPFASTKPSGGLGLAVARRFARLHGGDVEHESMGTGGARFVLRLPREEVR